MKLSYIAITTLLSLVAAHPLPAGGKDIAQQHNGRSFERGNLAIRQDDFVQEEIGEGDSEGFRDATASAPPQGQSASAQGSPAGQSNSAPVAPQGGGGQGSPAGQSNSAPPAAQGGGGQGGPGGRTSTP